jgi:hypothetical protein
LSFRSAAEESAVVFAIAAVFVFYLSFPRKRESASLPIPSDSPIHRVPHLRRSFIATKVGIARLARPSQDLSAASSLSLATNGWPILCGFIATGGLSPKATVLESLHPACRLFYCNSRKKVARWSTGASMKKLFRWAVYIFAAIGFLVCSAVLSIFLTGPIEDLSWHCFHSSKRVFDGHAYSLPIWWRPIKPWGDDKLALTRLSSEGLGHFPTLSIHSQPEGIKDESTVMEDQQRLIASLNRPTRNGWPHALIASPETIHSASLTFYCWKTASIGMDLVTMTCEAPGTDWRINVSGNHKTMRESEQILQSFH